MDVELNRKCTTGRDGSGRGESWIGKERKWQFLSMAIIVFLIYFQFDPQAKKGTQKRIYPKTNNYNAST